MEKELEKLTQKTAGGKLKLVDSSSAENSISKIDSLYDLLIQKLERHGIGAAGLKQDAQALTKIGGLIKSYQDKMGGIEKEEAKLSKEIEKQKREKEKLLELQKSQQVVSKEEVAAQKVRIKSAKDELKAKEEIAKKAQDALDNRINNSGGNYSKEQINEKGSGLRKTKEFKAYKDAMKEMAVAQDNYNTELSKGQSFTTQEDQAAAIAEIDKRLQAATNNLQQFNSEQRMSLENKAFEEIKQQLLELQGIDFTSYGIDPSEINSIEDLRAALEKINIVAAKNAQATSGKITNNVKKMGVAYKNAGEDVNVCTEANKQLNEQLNHQQAISDRVKSFLGAAGAAQLMRRAFNDAMTTIKELDATMTEMAVVTDFSVGDYWDQLPEYTQRANELGVSVNDAYKAATLYYQQGLKTNEVVSISNETLKMAKIAGLSAADATDKMTAALRGFNMELNEASAQKVADVYSELAAITAADVEEISSAMTKTASIANSAGMEFETTAAFLSQIIETTRESAETAGTAMKTIIARFQELKKAPGEIGEVDGEIIDANKIETALRSVGVSLRDSSGQFRELDDVFMELSSKWSSLDTNTQRYIATIAAGSRQQSRFIAMMSNYERTQELVTAANNSAGASNKQFEKTMDSLESKVEKLRNTWHEFTMGIMNSDLVKAGVDILTKFLEVLNKITSSFNGLGGSILKIGSIFGIFKLGQAVFDKIKPMLFRVLTSVKKDFEDAGYQSGYGFTKKAQEGREAAKAEAAGLGAGANKEQESKQTLEAAAAQGLSKNQQITDGKIWKNEGGGFTGKVANAGIGVLNSMGVGSFVQAAEAQKQKQAARDTLGKNKEERAQKAQAYQENKEKLEGMKKDYTVQKNGSVSKKGRQGFLPKEEAEQAKKEIEDLTASVEEYENASENMANASQTQWSSISDGLSKASGAAAGAGMAFGMVGQALTDAGFEEAGEAISGVGTAFMVLSTVMQIASSIIPLLAPAFGVAGTAGTTSGLATTASWSVVGLIVMAVMAAIIITVAIVMAVLAALKNASPEAKLKKAEEAADKASEAAQRAAESYENLKNSLNDLGEGYKQLDNLRKGTDEWKESVRTLNSQVLDLINQYPELAGLVENEGGVLKLDVDSQEVQDVLDKYDRQAAVARGAELGAKLNVSKAKQQVELSKMDAVKNVAAKRAAENLNPVSVEAQAKDAYNLAGGGAKGVLAGVGSVLLGPLGAIANSVQASSAAKKDTTMQKAMEALADDVLSGGAQDADHIVGVLTANGMVESEARLMAESLANDSEALLEFANSVNAANAEQKAYYQAMASNAQSMIDLGKYSEQEIDQMSSVIDGDWVQQETERLEALYSNDDSAVTEAALEEYMLSSGIASEVKAIRNNKIVYYDEEGKKQKVDKDVYIKQMIAAQATENAAAAMENLPDAIDQASKVFRDVSQAAGDAFEKMFSSKGGKTITASELQDVGEAREKIQEAWDNMSEESRSVWGTFEEFCADFDRRANNAKLAFEDATKALNNMNIDGDMYELFGQMSAEAAQAWSKNLQTIYASGGDAGALQGALNGLIDGLSAEQTAQVMSQINAIDTSSIDDWKDLEQVFKDLNIPIAKDALQEFINKGIEVSGAIKKIDFSSLNDELQKTYALIKKIKEDGTRTFDEESYKAIIAANKNLAKDFRQIGEEFIYIGSSMDALTIALEENTIAVLGEANRQLGSLIEFAGIAEARKAEGKATNTDKMDTVQLQSYLTEVVAQASALGLDVANLGEEGFTNGTNFFDPNISTDTLRKWANAFQATAGNKDLYEQEYAKNLEESNIVKLSYNNTIDENVGKVTEGSAYAEALQLQAISSGGVTEELLEQYKLAIEEYKEAEATYNNAIANGKSEEEAQKESGLNDIKTRVSGLSGQIATQAKKIIDSNNKNRQSYADLVERATDALYEQYQKEIDKLTEIKDATEEANAELIGKIQEQIDEERQARQNEKEKKAIEDMQSRQAYLGMDTSGAGLLEQKQLDKQIEEAEEAYRDSLIDQAIQKMEDANAKAEEQRNKQIDLAQSQLDYQMENGDLARQAEEIVQSSLDQINNGTNAIDTRLGTLLWGSEGEGLGDLAEETWVSDLQHAMVAASNYFSSLGFERPVLNETDSAFAETEKQIRAGINKGGSNYSSSSAYLSSSEGQAARKAYEEAGGNGSDFDARVQNSWGRISADAVQQRKNEANAKYTTAMAKLKTGEASYNSLESELLTQYREANGGADVVSEDEARAAVAQELWQNVGGAIKGDFHIPKTTPWDQDRTGDMDLSTESGDDNAVRHSGSFAEGKTWELLESLRILGIDGKGQGAKGDDDIVYLHPNAGDGGGRIWVKWRGGRWKYVKNQNGEETPATLTGKMQDTLKKRTYKQGGLADFTGPAWLDGTKSKPEIILNQKDSANFILLKDILNDAVNGKAQKTEKTSQGDNHFDIEINVEKIESDYDVEQLAKKIRDMIYEDAKSRNVNAVGRLR